MQVASFALGRASTLAHSAAMPGLRDRSQARIESSCCRRPAGWRSRLRNRVWSMHGSEACIGSLDFSLRPPAACSCLAAAQPSPSTSSSASRAPCARRRPPDMSSCALVASQPALGGCRPRCARGEQCHAAPAPPVQCAPLCAAPLRSGPPIRRMQPRGRPQPPHCSSPPAASRQKRRRCQSAALLSRRSHPCPLPSASPSFQCRSAPAPP